MPGGFSPLYARLAQEAGFECFSLAGFSFPLYLYGLPDSGILGMRDQSITRVTWRAATSRSSSTPTPDSAMP